MSLYNHHCAGAGSKSLVLRLGGMRTRQPFNFHIANSATSQLRVFPKKGRRTEPRVNATRNPHINPVAYKTSRTNDVLTIARNSQIAKSPLARREVNLALERMIR